MNPLARVLLLTAILATLASSALAQGGFRVDFENVASDTLSTHAQGLWRFRMQHKDVVVRWNCSHFTHALDPSLHADATIRAAVTSLQGPVLVTPNASMAKTDISHGTQVTGFDMHMQGTGKLDVLVDLEIDTQDAAAGEHYATVELTIIGL